MSEEPKTTEETPEVVEEAPEQPQATTLNDMKVGYVVALTKDGDFFFDVFGKEKGLVGILGLHAHASMRIDMLHQKTQMTGDTLTNEVGKAVAILLQKVEAIQQVVAPKKPDDEIE